MNRLKFEGPLVREIVEHMTTATSWSQGYGETGVACPQLILVHDDGIYIMSNGHPAQTIGERDRRLVCHAKGYNPKTDPDVWERSREAVGGDDFSEFLTLGDDQIALILSDNFDYLSIGVNAKSLSITVMSKHPTEARPKTDAEMSRSLQRSMRTRLLFVRDGAVLQSKPISAEQMARLKADRGYLALLTKFYRAEVVLNVLSPTEALRTYRQAVAASPPA